MLSPGDAWPVSRTVIAAAATVPVGHSRLGGNDKL